MNLRTFSAPTFAEAMAQVKAELGPSAVILHARTVEKRGWLGLCRSEVVEITAGKDINVPARPGKRGSTPAAAVAAPAGRPVAGVRMKATPVAVMNQPPMEKPAQAAQTLLETPAGNRAMMMALSNDVQGLKSLLEDLVLRTRRETAPGVPDNLFEHYSQLIQNQVAEELAGDLVRQLQSYRPEQLEKDSFVRDKLAEHVEKMIPSSGPIRRSKEIGPHVVALIGPTGVGKTTTLAKLAANLKLRENRRVGLITIDTYRIAAIDQLRRYAELMGSPLKVVNSMQEMKAALEGMSQCEYVLIDTAGRSPRDTLKLNELREFLDSAQPDEVHLVLSSTANQTCIEEAIERFSQVRVDKIIFTKLDEAVHVGVVLNVVRKVNKALSYVTTGQNVPDDIEVGRGGKLAQLILKKGGQSS